jgi:hypothetical protein
VGGINKGEGEEGGGGTMKGKWVLVRSSLVDPRSTKWLLVGRGTRGHGG